MKNEEINQLSTEEVQKEILRFTIQNNKKLGSISFAINFIGWVILAAIVWMIFRAF